MACGLSPFSLSGRRLGKHPAFQGVRVNLRFVSQLLLVTAKISPYPASHRWGDEQNILIPRTSRLVNRFSWNKCPCRPPLPRHKGGTGGYKKKVMTHGRAVMHTAFERLLPAMQSGGYIPSVTTRPRPAFHWKNIGPICACSKNTRRKSLAHDLPLT